MRTHRVVAGATLATLALGMAAASGRAQNDPAGRAVRYLQSQQSSDGSIAGDPGPTEDALLGMAAAGYDPATLRTSASAPSAYDYLAAHLPAATSSAGKAGKLILAVTAGRRDPATFGGLDLVTTLQGYYVAATGAYGDGGTFSQSLAILGLVSAGRAVPANAVTYLKSLQDSDGSWNYTAAANAAAGGDTNSTAIALMALVASSDHSRDATALTWLHGQQQSDGGFPFFPGLPSDPDSDAIVLQALAAAGQHEWSAAWTKGGHTPLDNLLTMQDTATGGFTYPGSSAPDAFTTSQVPAGIEMQPLPVSAAWVAQSGLTQQTAAGVAALRYLASQQATDGSIAGDPGPTEDTLMGMAAAGYDPATLRSSAASPSAYDYLAAHVAAATATAGKTGKLILAVDAGRADPKAFGGQDLLATLQGYYVAATGAYGDGGTFSQSLAILGLVAAGRAVPANSVTYLRALQDGDGSWNYTATTNGTGGDTNSTAIALMALAAAGDHSRDSGALAWLRTQQNADGGFPYQAGLGSDPDSDALVLQALQAALQDPVSTAWARGGATVVSHLLSVQDPATGGYTFPGSAGPDAFTTSQVPAGIERVPLPVLTRFAAGTSPVSGSTPTPPPPAPPTPQPPTPAPNPPPASPPAGGTAAASGAPTAAAPGAAAAPTTPAASAPPPARTVASTSSPGKPQGPAASSTPESTPQAATSPTPGPAVAQAPAAPSRTPTPTGGAGAVVSAGTGSGGMPGWAIDLLAGLGGLVVAGGAAWAWSARRTGAGP